MVCGVATAAEPAGAPGAKPAKPDTSTLTGRGAAEVQSVLGKPMGRMQTATGALWLYPDWKIQFDKSERVAKVEKDAPVRLAPPSQQYLALSEAIAKAERERAADNLAARLAANTAPDTSRARVLSRQGERVDLPSLLPDGKVTIVDFFAPWCGPCRQISPALEKMAQDDPEVALLKIDIVNWGTPVAVQFGLQAIPNIRVFDKNKRQVGEACSSVSAVAQSIRKAKGL